MTSKMLLDLTKLFQKCPHCKSEKLDGSSGSLEVTSTLIRRTCACGYELNIIIDEKLNPINKNNGSSQQVKPNKINW